MTSIGLPEKRTWEIDIPEEDWPVPQVPEDVPLEVPEKEPVGV